MRETRGCTPLEQTDTDRRGLELDPRRRAGTDSCRATLFLEAFLEVAFSKCGGWTLGCDDHAVECKGSQVNIQALLTGASTHWRPFWKHVLEETGASGTTMKLHVLLLSLARID
eukprot:3567660-Amphidinium_carterae.1